MAEELKDLIEKIQIEGVKAAEDKALVIETLAMKRAEEIRASAEKESARMIADAREQIARLEEGAKSSIKQASRDTVLSLRREIISMLERLVAGHVHKALSAEDLSKILLTIIKGCSSEARGKVVVTLRKEDLDKVEKAVFSELGHEAKAGVILRSTADIRGGFLISYDGGSSHFDFSDKALAEYLAAQLKASLGDIVKESVTK